MPRYTRNLHEGEVKNFNSLLARHGRVLVPTAPDGNCLFRAIAQQVFDTEERHADVRRDCTSFLLEHEAELLPFLAPGTRQSFQRYVKLMARDGTWGGHLEMCALGRAYRCKIWVYRLEEEQPTCVVEDGDGGEIHLVYHERGTKHYSSAALLSGPSSVPSPPGQAPSLTDMMEGLTVTGGTEDDAATVSDRGSLSPSTEPCDPRRARRTTGDMMGMSFSSLKALYREVLGRTYKGMRHKKLVIAAIEDAWRQEDLLASP